MGKRSKTLPSKKAVTTPSDSRTNAAETSQGPTSNSRKPRPLNVVFVHLDLGIGGAEQLVLQLATASMNLGHQVELITTRCDDNHCFAAFSKSQNGKLANQVCIYGNWIPVTILGMATALMSTIRMLYLTWQVCSRHRYADIVVMDVLPTSLPLLLTFFPSAATLFYCHFPDKLLLTAERGNNGILKSFYRSFLDTIEELTLGLADLLVVNSKFTRRTVQQTFPTLPANMPVLYPALDTTNMVKPNEKSKTAISPIVSLNRFERKKNIGLLIEAYKYLQDTYQSISLPPLVIAGGYDTKNVENVEHRGELQALAETLGVEVDFRLDISDSERATLFQTALSVVYTPDKEHFGIVPLEAMYAGTPVVAVNSGGPTETILDGQTGFLRKPNPQEFGEALFQLIKDPAMATTMGKAGRRHVEKTFGAKRLEKEWKVLLTQTQQLREETRPNHTLWANVGIYFMDAIFATIAVIVMTAILRKLGVLSSDEGIIAGLRRGWMGDEL